MLDLRRARPLEGVGDGPARAAREWERSDLANILAPFDPVVVSSLSSGLGLADSDLDVVCDLRCGGFEHVVAEAFGNWSQFRTWSRGPLFLVAFQGHDLQIELVGEHRPVEEQTAYRHAVAHRRLVERHGPLFAAAVRELRRRTGMKTEPAVAQVLGLTGDPYAAVDRFAD